MIEWGRATIKERGIMDMERNRKEPRAIRADF
jgi:hypothetical protein